MAKSANLYARIEPDVKEQTETPLNIAGLSEKEFHSELENGYIDMKAGRTKDARQAFADIRKDYGL